MINVVCGIRSTGRICIDLAKELEAQGHEVKIAYGRETVPEQYQKYAIRIGTDIGVKINALKARIFDNEGLNAIHATKKFLKWADTYSPDLIWLHNIHGYYLNYELLFKWIKTRPQMQVKWTLHDCWSFTGHCTHFSYVNCEQWKDKCKKCIQNAQYPKSYYKDHCTRNFEKKKQAFCNVKNLTIVVVSNWLKNLVIHSFLNEYPIQVEYNRIDTAVFKPTQSDFLKVHNIEGKKIILGVASTWDDRKGLSDFIKLSKLLSDEYKIVLVGLNEKQISKVPSVILGLPRTNTPEELAAIYTAADVFVNPSREETFGLTTIEALACGTSVIVYKDTACEEIAKKYGGIIVSNIEEVYLYIVEHN